MARRILDTAFWDDPDIASLSYPERLLFTCMVTNEALRVARQVRFEHGEKP